VAELRFYTSQSTQKIGHSGDVLPSQSRGVVRKKLAITQLKQQHKNKIV